MCIYMSQLHGVCDSHPERESCIELFKKIIQYFAVHIGESDQKKSGVRYLEGNLYSSTHQKFSQADHVVL